LIVGLIGAGNMGLALARGWNAAEAGPDDLLLSDVDAARAGAAADELGGKAVSNRELAEGADLVVLCMKPASLNAVAEEIRVTVSERKLPVASILGATSIARVEQAFGPGTPVLRFMPNMAAEVRAGTFCYAGGTEVDPPLERDVLDLFGVLGEMVAVEERLIDAATALSGCGPAFFALVVEALVDAGVKEGLSAPQASELAISTMAGSAELLRRRGGDTVAVKRAVASPGGVTAAGLAALEARGLRAAVGAAVEAVVRKAREVQPDVPLEEHAR
jgi:pyrroline-5-carboxylate reductase